MSDDKSTRFVSIRKDLRDNPTKYLQMGPDQLIEYVGEIVMLDDVDNRLKLQLVNMLHWRNPSGCIIVLNYLVNTHNMDIHIYNDYILYVCLESESYEILEYLFTTYVYTESNLKNMINRYGKKFVTDINVLDLVNECDVNVQPYIDLKLVNWARVTYGCMVSIIEKGYIVPPDAFTSFVENGKIKCVKLLLDCCPELIANTDQNALISMAIVRMDTEMVELLKSYGFDFPNLEKHFNVTDEDRKWLKTMRSLDVSDDQIIHILFTGMNILIKATE